jgi:TRAP-type mannitol/chloroaromatic compound transport system permease small subunit
MEMPMGSLLLCSRWIDALNLKVGKFTGWLILLTTAISAGNAIVRKMFDMSSNSLLEIQWYLFAGVFLLGAGYGLLRNSHVRIDFISSRLTDRARNWIDFWGFSLVLTPFCLLSIYLSWPLFVQALVSGEMSQNAGGLVRWPAYALIPLGFFLLQLQGLSEMVKRWAFLQGQGPDVLSTEDALSDDQKRAAELEKMAQPQGDR